MRVGIVAAGLLASGCGLVSSRLAGEGEGFMLINGVPVGSPTPLQGWTAEPTEPDPTLLADAAQLCLEPFRQIAGDVDLSEHLLIQDQRGPDGAGFMWTDGDDAGWCFVSRSADGGAHLQAVGWTLANNMTPGSMLMVTTHHCGPPTVVEGVVPAGTESLVIETEAGKAVTASVADGRFMAWWPEADNPVWLRTESTEADFLLSLC
jgi:hypothetical protein